MERTEARIYFSYDGKAEHRQLHGIHVAADWDELVHRAKTLVVDILERQRERGQPMVAVVWLDNTRLKLSAAEHQAILDEWQDILSRARPAPKPPFDPPPESKAKPAADESSEEPASGDEPPPDDLSDRGLDL